MKSKKTKSGGRSTVSRVLKTVAIILSALIAGFIIFFSVAILKLDAWHEFEPEKITDVAQTLVIYDGEGNEALRLHSSEDRENILLQELPDYVKNAFISAEDARFYEHSGIDIIRIAGAAWEDIKAGGYVQGASTISQQLIKLSHLSGEKTITRKLEEAVLAYQMEKAFTKDEILNMYLNYVYFGGGYYGIEAAARGYFGISAKELSCAQAAMLAGILKSPSRYAPHIDIEASLGRRNNILNLMCEYGYISETQRDQYSEETPVIVKSEEEEKRGYYIDTAIEQALEILDIDMETLLTGGYRIYTALDAQLQNKCEMIFDDNAFFPSETCQGAIVVREANTGFVVALVGGRNVDTAMAFNRATDIQRQPGSVIKPIIAYAPALEHADYTAATIILDERTSFADYSPSNYSNKYYGWVTLREAIKRSLNIPAVKVLSDIGVDVGREFAEKCGAIFDETDTSLALALGGFKYGVSPWQIAAAYSCFASGGLYNESTVIRRITDSEGKTLYEYKAENTRVMSEENAYVLTGMLQSAISDGTGHRLGELSYMLAGKTGTVGDGDDNRDAWMAAYNSEYATAVWIGYDTSANGEALPSDSTGGKYPALILSEVFSSIYETVENVPQFTRPSGIVECKLDSYTLKYENKVLLANALTPDESVFSEIFVKGTEPIETTSYWTVPLPVSDLSAYLPESGAPIVTFTPRQNHIVYRLYRHGSDGSSKLLIEWKGSDGRAAYTDKSTKGGVTYDYYVMPVHPKLVINAKLVTGPKSKVKSITMPQSIYLVETDIMLSPTPTPSMVPQSIYLIEITPSPTPSH